MNKIYKFLALSVPLIFSISANAEYVTKNSTATPTHTYSYTYQDDESSFFHDSTFGDHYNDYFEFTLGSSALVTAFFKAPLSTPLTDYLAININKKNGSAFDFVPGAASSGTNPVGPLTLTAGTYQIVFKRASDAAFTGAFTVAAVPEPETYALMLAGLGLIGFTARRRQA